MNVRSMIVSTHEAEEIADEELHANIRALVYRHLGWLRISEYNMACTLTLSIPVPH